MPKYYKKVLEATIIDLPDEINQLQLGLYNGQIVNVVTMNPPAIFDYKDEDKKWKILNLPIEIVLNSKQIKVIYGF